MSGRVNPNAVRRVDVHRGGSWYDTSADARVADRAGDTPSYLSAPSLRNGDLGFRLVEEVEKQREAYRVNRGGSWGIAPALARVANRGVSAPSLRNGDLGFRLVEQGSAPAFARVANRGGSAPSSRYYDLGFRLVEEQGMCNE